LGESAFKFAVHALIVVGQVGAMVIICAILLDWFVNGKED